MKRMCCFHRHGVVFVGVLSLSLLAASAWAGQQAASIVGQAADESGAVLPGVTVTATSPALQVPEIAVVTTERGEYRLSPLPIGTYTVTYALSGFQTVKRENIQLTLGFVAKVDVLMKVGSLEESITVSGAAPLIDVTSAGATTELTKETLDSVPSTRNGLLSLMAQAPGSRSVLDLGGNNFAAIPTFHAYGQTGEQWTTVEGVLTTTPNGSGSGNYWDYSTFEETKVQGIGKSVDVGSRGLQISAIVKSGGNNFHGGAFYSGSTHQFAGSNLDSTLAAQNITSGGKLQSQGDYSGELGGRIIANKLWFYTSGRRRWTGTGILGVNEDTGCTINGCQLTNKQAIFSQHEGFGTGKVSYQITPGSRLIGFYQQGLKYDDGTGVNTNVPWTSRLIGHIRSSTGKLEYQLVKGNLVTSLQYGAWGFLSHYVAQDHGAPTTTDLVTLKVTGDAQPSRHLQQRHDAVGTVSWYKPNGFLGNHQVKLGFEYLNQPGFDGAVDDSQFAGNYTSVYRSGVPFEIITNNNPTLAALNVVNDTSVYLTDVWTIARRLTLNLGARYTHDDAFIPAQCRDPGTFAPAACMDKIQFTRWNSVAPRIAAAYDLTGDSKTVIKAGWARYQSPRYLTELQPVNPFNPITRTYRWHDNGDKIYQPGEVDLSLTGLDFVSQTGGTGVPAPNEPQPKQDELSLSMERQLVSNLAVRATGVYTVASNVQRQVPLLRPYSAYNIPITNPIPGPNGAVVAGNPNGTLTYYDYPAAYVGSQFNQSELTTVPGQPNQTFRSFEVAASKRLSRRWSFMVSYSATLKNVSVPENAAYNPNTEIFTADNNWEWLGRGSGTYLFPYGLTFAASFEHRSGDPAAPQALFSGGTQIPTIVLNTAPIGTIRLPTINDLDLRVEKSFPTLKGHKLSVRLNVYNSLNANTTTAWIVRLGPTYLYPTAIMPPRTVELGASYTF